MRCLVVFLGWLLSSSSLVLGHRTRSRTVQTANGPIIGHAAPHRGQVTEFLGIPYAEPPLGSLRFAPPRKLTTRRTVNAKEWVSGWEWKNPPQGTETLTPRTVSVR